MRIPTMRLALGAGVVLALALPATAQDEPPAAPPPTTRPAAATPTLAERVANEIARYENDQRLFFETYSKIEDAEKKRAYVQEAYPNPQDRAKEIWALVEAHRAEAGAIDGLLFVADHAQGEPANAAAKALVTHHLASPKLGLLAQTLGWSRSDEADAWLLTLSEKSEHAAVRGLALYSRTQRMRGDPEAKAKLLETIARDYADVEVGDRKLGKVVEADLFELRRLGIGAIAPEIEGKDLDGVPFKLSDYRGKVVVLDFWGHW